MDEELIEEVVEEPIRYVTYDEAGNLTGCYLQILQPAHADHYIVVEEIIVMEWTSYRANAARDGIELIPPPPPEAD